MCTAIELERTIMWGLHRIGVLEHLMQVCIEGSGGGAHCVAIPIRE